MLLLNSEPSLKCLEHPFDCEPFHLTHSSFYYTKVYGLFIAYSNSTVNDHRPLIHSSKVSCHRPFPSLSRSLSRLSLSSYFGNETSFINSKAHNATSHHKWKSFSLSLTHSLSTPFWLSQSDTIFRSLPVPWLIVGLAFSGLDNL